MPIHDFDLSDHPEWPAGACATPLFLACACAIVRLHGYAQPGTVRYGAETWRMADSLALAYRCHQPLPVGVGIEPGDEARATAILAWIKRPTWTGHPAASGRYFAKLAMILERAYVLPTGMALLASAIPAFQRNATTQPRSPAYV